MDSSFLQHVKAFLKVIMLRRKKESTAAGLEIPSKTEVVIHLPLTDIQKRLYLKVLTGVTGEMESSFDHPNSHVLETPPPTPGSGNNFQIPSPSSLKAKPRRSILNTLMELRKVSRFHTST